MWEFNENNMELSLNFFAHVNGAAEGELIYFPDSADFDKKDLRPRQMLDCSSELLFHFAATLDGNKVKIGNIDNVS